MTVYRDSRHFDVLQDYRAEDSLDGEPVSLDRAVRVFLALSSPALPVPPAEHQAPSAAPDDNGHLSSCTGGNGAHNPDVQE